MNTEAAPVKLSPFARFSPTVKTQKRLALWLLIAQGVITITGAIVRVTGSGLGCNTWPNCHEGSLVPVEGAAPWLHQAIEFGNRLLTFVLVGLFVALFVAVVGAKRRRTMIWAAAFQGFGIVVQAVIGGISVLLDLQWWSVALHFLPSMLLVWGAGVMYIRIGQPDDGQPHPTFSGGLKALAGFCALLLSAVLVTGTMVTGAGVHSGDEGVGMQGRLEVDIDWMAHVHAWTMYAYLAVTIVLVVGLIISQAPRQCRNYGFILIVVTVLQGVIGIMQYRLGIPRWTVPIHLGMCSLVVAYCAMLWGSSITRTNGSAYITGSPLGDEKRTYLEAVKTN